MKKLLSCDFNIDTACVELKYSDGSMLAIDCDAVEDEYAKTICQRSALDYLVYNAPLEYADLVLTGDVEGYLKSIVKKSKACAGAGLASLVNRDTSRGESAGRTPSSRTGKPKCERHSW